MKKILKQLKKMKRNLHRKAILFIMQAPKLRRFADPFADVFKEAIEDLAESEIFVFVGHFENKDHKELSKKNNTNSPAWNLNNGYLKNGTETVVLPYTIPIKED